MDFNPEMLVLARESRGHTQSSLARSVGVVQATISKAESGTIPVAEELVAKLSAVLQYPTQFFSQRDAVYGFGSSIFYHRRQQSLSNRTLRQLHAQVNIRRNHIKRLLRAAELDSSEGFLHLDLDDYGRNVEKIAQLVRGAWRLPPGPVRNLTEAIESNGGIVVRKDFETRKIDAISEWTEPCPPLFFVNSHPEITGDRLRYSLAHEVGHVVMHRLPTPDMEDQANRFASEFLMPAHEIKPYLFRLNIPRLAVLKAEWKVSMAALIERAFELGSLSRHQRQNLIIGLKTSTHSFREPKETDIPIENPRVLDELVELHMHDLGYSIDEISSMVAELETNFRSLYLPNSKVVNFR